MVKLQNKFNWRIETLLLSVLLIAYFVGYLLPMLFLAAENVQMASVFYPDEGRYVKVIRGALEAKTLRIHFVSYGHFFFNLVLIPLLFLQQFFTITDVHILLSLRGISWIFGLGSAWLTFVMTKRFFGSQAAWMSAIFLLVVPLTFLEYSTIAHPDTMQLFFILASLYYTCLLSEKLKIKHLLRGSAMAGLAFSAKYAGILLVPLIAFVFVLQLYQSEKLEVSPLIPKRVKTLLLVFAAMCFLTAISLQKSVILLLFSSDGNIESDWIWRLVEAVRMGLLILCIVFVALFYLKKKKLWNSEQLKLDFGFYYGILAAMAFGLAFVVSSPNSLLELQFVQGLIYEGHNTRTGGFFTANWQQILSQWYEVLTSKYLLGAGLFVLGLAGTIGSLVRK